MPTEAFEHAGRALLLLTPKPLLRRLMGHVVAISRLSSTPKSGPPQPTPRYQHSIRMGGVDMEAA